MLVWPTVVVWPATACVEVVLHSVVVHSVVVPPAVEVSRVCASLVDEVSAFVLIDGLAAAASVVDCSVVRVALASELVSPAELGKSVERLASVVKVGKSVERLASVVKVGESVERLASVEVSAAVDVSAEATSVDRLASVVRTSVVRLASVDVSDTPSVDVASCVERLASVVVSIALESVGVATSVERLLSVALDRSAVPDVGSELVVDPELEVGPELEAGAEVDADPEVRDVALVCTLARVVVPAPATCVVVTGISVIVVVPRTPRVDVDVAGGMVVELSAIDAVIVLFPITPPCPTIISAKRRVQSPICTMASVLPGRWKPNAKEKRPFARVIIVVMVPGQLTWRPAMRWRTWADLVVVTVDETRTKAIGVLERR